MHIDGPTDGQTRMRRLSYICIWYVDADTIVIRIKLASADCGPGWR